MFRTEGIDHLGLAVENPKRSANWYMRVLGLERRFYNPHYIHKFSVLATRPSFLGYLGGKRETHKPLRGRRSEAGGSVPRLVASALFGVCFLWTTMAAQDAIAELYVPLPVDISLVDVGAIIVASIEYAGPSDVVTCGTEVRLEVDDVLVWNFAAPPQALTFHIPIPWREMSPPRAVLARHAMKVEPGKTYLLVLGAEEWAETPISTSLSGVYEVSEDSDTLRCQGAEAYIFGMDAYGFRCSTQEQNLGRPFSLAEVAAAVGTVIAKAESVGARPSSLPLQLSPAIIKDVPCIGFDAKEEEWR